MSKKNKKRLKRIIIGFAVAVVGLLLFELVNKWAGLAILAAAYIVLAYDVLKAAFMNILHGHLFDENFLMTVATIGAIVCKEYEEAVAVMLLYQIGELFQSIAVDRSRKSVRALMDIRPDMARVVKGETELEVDPGEVNIGDIIVIRPGERIPLDGTICEGATEIDTRAITGESIPSEASVGDPVISGCVNISGVIKVEVTSEFAKSTVSKVLELVEESSARKANAEQFITVFARVYTPIIVGLAALLILAGSLVTKDFITWFYRGMTFLLISCPCALVISIPLSFFGGIGGAGKKGILIKGGNLMDTLSKIDTLVLDKTGTVTEGKFRVSGVEPSKWLVDQYGKKAEDILIRFAAYSEVESNHPIAQAIVEALGEAPDKSLITSISETSGKGVDAVVEGHEICTGKKDYVSVHVLKDSREDFDECAKEHLIGSVIYVSIDGEFAGHIHVADGIKDGVKDTLNKARKAGISKIVMLTGDNKKAADSVAKEIGVDMVYSELLPADKVSKVEELINEGRKVAFVGDGINDAPVIARADVGIAMGAMGSDAAIEAADVVIMTDELSKVAQAKSIARKTLRIVKENIVFSIGVKVLVLILAACGLTGMWAAIFADVGVAFIAIMNAMRALSVK